MKRFYVSRRRVATPIADALRFDDLPKIANSEGTSAFIGMMKVGLQGNNDSALPLYNLLRAECTLG